MPPSRPVLIIATVALLLLTGGGLLLVRPSPNGTPHLATTAGSSAPSTPSSNPSPVATVNAQVSFGPGLVETVSQHVVFDRPASHVTLSIPRQAAFVAGGFDPRVGIVQIQTDNGRSLDVTHIVRAGTSLTIDLPTEVLQLDLSYVAHGSVQRSRPSAANRASALVAPLAPAATSVRTTALHINGVNVTNIGCVQPDGFEKSCGSQSARGWTVIKQPDEQDVAVVAQLDLMQ